MKILCAGAFAAASMFLAANLQAASPPNDNFADAPVLSGASGSGSGTTVGATIEPGEPLVGEASGTCSVWYAWTAPSDGIFVFTKHDNTGAPYMSVFTGAALNSLTRVAGSESADGTSLGLNRYTFSAQSGVTYYVGFNSGNVGEPFTYTWKFYQTPANDNFGTAQPISGESGSVSGNATAASVESGEPHSGDGNSLWYVWTAPRTGSFRFDVTGYVNSYHIYSGQRIDSLTELLAPQYYPGIRVTEGQQYFIQVSGTASNASNSTGDFTLAWAPGPANDDLANAALISGTQGSVTGNTRGGTQEPGEPAISGYTGSESIWYRWVAPATAWYNFQLTSQFMGPLLAAYTGSQIDDLKPVASNARPVPAGTTSNTVTFHADAGVTYSLAAAVLPSSFNLSSRDLTLSWTQGTSPADAALLNLSTRANIGVDAEVLIGGFIIKGDAPKKVMIRGIGPSLQAGGTPLAGRLLDPLLELHDSTGGVIFSNDDWVSSPQKQQIIDSTIAPADDKEPAIIATLAPGAYTATVRGTNGGTGIGLMEIYDLDVASASRLVNISTRGKVDKDANVMIGGLIVGGSLPTKVAIRALGPSLENATPPVAGALSDPSVELHDTNGSAYPIAQNSDWLSAADVTAAGLAPGDEHEAAFITTLAPGNYTAIVRGQNNSTGVALVEIYNLN